MTEDVPIKRTGTTELRQQIPGTVVIVGIVVLNGRIPHTTVQIESTAIFAATRAIVMRFVALNDNTVRVPYPDSNRTAAFVIV